MGKSKYNVSRKPLRCFLITPCSPKEKFDDFYKLISDICERIGLALNCKLKVIRADKIVGSGVIQNEIWNEIKSADVIIADVSGLNGNVMLELGVASAWRKKEQVIIIKEDNEDEKFLFDIGPARHLIYKRTFEGYREFANKLCQSLKNALTSAPDLYVDIPKPTFPVNIDFSVNKDPQWLIGPSYCHRKLGNNYLEFGSLYIFKNSWLSVSNINIPKFELNAKLNFSSQVRTDVGAWIGVSVRNNNFFANYGHLIYLTSKGQVMRTIPFDDIGGYNDSQIGVIEPFDPLDKKYYNFKISFDDKNISMYVDNIGDVFPIKDMPFVFSSGKILFQSYHSRMAIKSFSIKILE